MRKLGDILLDLEVILDEMVDSHELQVGDILNLVYGHLVIHRPDAKEVYVSDGSSPVFKYGPPPNRKKMKKDLLKLLAILENCRLGSKEADEIIEIVEKEYK